METLHGKVVSVSRSPKHNFSKEPVSQIRILAGQGVEGDAHAGEKVQHLYRVRQNPDAPNLCQVHLIAAEFLDELQTLGFMIRPGQMGENLIVRGIDLISLPVRAILRVGQDVILEITGLRDPCNQLNKLQPGLMKACITHDPTGTLIRKAGVMSIAIASGTIRPGDSVLIELPEGQHRTMGPV